MKETKPQEVPAVRPPKPEEKRPYTPPELKEHGSAAEVTLQTFFGSFSP